MNEDARTKSAFSTVEACRSVFKLDYHQLTKIAQNVEAFDACGKITHGTFIGATAHMKKHSAPERLSCLQSVFLRLSNARCFMETNLAIGRKAPHVSSAIFQNGDHVTMVPQPLA